MNNYAKWKTVKLRKQLVDSFRDGLIRERGKRPSFPSKVFRLTNKATAVSWLENNEIVWSEYNSDGSIFTESNESNNNRDSEAKEGNENKDSEAKEEELEAEEISESDNAPEDAVKKELDGAKNGLNQIEYQFVTTKGTITPEQVDDGLQINQRLHKLADFTGYALHKINKVNSRIDKINEFGGGGEVIININDKEIKRSKGEHYHPKYKDICNFSKWYKNVMLVGKAGTGKTTVAQQVANTFDLDFAHLSCSGGMSEAHMLGRMLFDGTYVQSDFVRLYENGGVFLFDEFDAIDGNCAVVINSALANGTMSVPNRKDNPIAKRHDDCIVIVACNTWGTGYGSRQYTGRNRIDGATLDRFCSSKIYFDYDKKLERKLGNDIALCNALWELRDRVTYYKLEKIISTRLFLNGNIALTNGANLKEYFDTITVDWTKEEKSKCNISGIITGGK